MTCPTVPAKPVAMSNRMWVQMAFADPHCEWTSSGGASMYAQVRSCTASRSFAMRTASP